MASIRERNGKFNVIYSYTNEKVRENRNGKPMKRKPKQREEKRKLNIKRDGIICRP